jgi:hypothetical protein
MGGFRAGIDLECLGDGRHRRSLSPLARRLVSVGLVGRFHMDPIGAVRPDRVLAGVAKIASALLRRRNESDHLIRADTQALALGTTRKDKSRGRPFDNCQRAHPAPGATLYPGPGCCGRSVGTTMRCLVRGPRCVGTGGWANRVRHGTSLGRVLQMPSPASRPPSYLVHSMAHQARSRALPAWREELRGGCGELAEQDHLLGRLGAGDL